MDPTKTDLAREFNEWYKAQFQGVKQIYMEGIRPNDWGLLRSIVLYKNSDNYKFSTAEYNIVANKIIIKIFGTTDINGEATSYYAYVSDINNSENYIKIIFTKDNQWYYKNGETFYFNENGPIDNVEAVFKNRDIFTETSNGLEGVVPNSIPEKSNKRKANDDNDINSKKTRSGIEYGGRKSRKSKKSRKNKKQKNRKTNRR